VGRREWIAYLTCYTIRVEKQTRWLYDVKVCMQIKTNMHIACAVAAVLCILTALASVGFFWPWATAAIALWFAVVALWWYGSRLPHSNWRRVAERLLPFLLCLIWFVGLCYQESYGIGWSNSGDLFPRFLVGPAGKALVSEHHAYYFAWSVLLVGGMLSSIVRPNLWTPVLTAVSFFLWFCFNLDIIIE